MSGRNARMRESLRGGVGIAKPLAKGRRAKRGRRREYKTVLRQCGIIDGDELEAIEGLLSLRPCPAVDLQAPCALPSKFTELRETTESLVAHVAAERRAVVEFWIPQVAHLLGRAEAVVTFVVDVLVSCTVVSRKECGSFIWNGRETSTAHLQGAPKMSLEKNETASKSELGAFCTSLLRIFHDVQNPLSLSDIEEEMSKTKSEAKETQLAFPLDGVVSVLVAAGIVREVSCGTERRYMLFFGAREEATKLEAVSSTSRESAGTKEILQQTAASRPPPSKTEEAIEPCPAATTDKVAATTLDVTTRPAIPMEASVASGQCFSLPEGSLLTTRAAVMEIVGRDVNQVGIVDILGKAPLPCHVAQGMPPGSNPMIALAVPQWMLMHNRPCQQVQQASLPAQIIAFDASGLNARAFSMQAEPPLYYVPALHGSSFETHLVAGPPSINICPSPNKPDGISQRSYPISRLKHHT